METNIANKKVLFLTGNVHPVISGDSIFSNGFLQKLSENNQIDLICPTIKNESELNIKNVNLISSKEYSYILRHFIRLLWNGAISIIGKVKIHGKLRDDYDLVIVDHLRSFGILKTLSRSLRGKKLIYIAHNVEFLNLEQKKIFSNSKKEKLSLFLNYGLKRNEKKLIDIATEVFCLTNHDKDELIKYFNARSVSKITIYYPFKKMDRTKIIPKSLLFIGSLDWFPNRKGFEDFMENCAKHLDNEWSFNVVGRCDDSIKKKYLNDKRVVFHNFVEDTDDFFKSMSFLIVANIHGTGIKVKIYEAIKKGLPVLTIKESSLGYSHLKENELLSVADNFNEITNLLRKHESSE